MGDVRLWLGGWLLLGLLASCQAPATSPRTSSAEGAPPIVIADKTETPASMPADIKIASIIRDVLQRMHDDGVTPANVAAHSTTHYSNPFVRVDAHGRIHTDITVTRVTPEVIADLQALQVQHLQTHAGQTIIQGWVPFDRVATIAALPSVRHIRPPRYAIRR